MSCVRQATRADVPRILNRATRSFRENRLTHPDFAAMFPDTIDDSEACARQWWVATEQDGTIAAGLQIVPRNLVLDREIKLHAAGIANVFTHPGHRGRGHMTRLLRRAITVLNDDGAPLSLLCGDRLRYRRFGWEKAGTNRRLDLNISMYRYGGGDLRSCEIRSWDGSANDTSEMQRVYDDLLCRTERSEAEFPRVLSRPGQVIWMCRAETGFAYASVKDGMLAEYAGEKRAFAGLLRFLLERAGSLSVDVPPGGSADPLTQVLLGASSGYAVQPVAMVRVHGLVHVLRSYLPHLEASLADWSGTLTLETAETGEKATVRAERGKVAVTAQDAPPDLTLELPDMARLLFGPFAPDAATVSRPMLRLAFPLPLYWHALSRV